MFSKESRERRERRRGVYGERLPHQ
uniref:Uncharacterized protein n=1 Tax=Arundo donax TaxID=35708 RepID=A0A0A8ZCC2_ARUDO